MAMGLLVAGFDFSPVHEDEFNDWYDTEHIPEREAVPGFGRIERWLGADNPKISIATYDLDTPAVLSSAAYRKIAGENLSPWSKRLTGKSKPATRSPIGLSLMATPQSTFTFARFTTGAHFAISARMCSPNFSGGPPTGS